MKALPSGHNQFSKTQTVTAEVTIYDTPLTVASRGLVYRPGFALPDFGSGINLLTASYAALDSHIDETTIPGLHDDTQEVTGRIPLIHDFWGTGAPLGVNAPNRAVLRYSGLVKEEGAKTLAFMGQGILRVFVNQAPFVTGNINATTPLIAPVRTFNANDRIDIFFWAVNVAWGGLSARVINNYTHTVTPPGAPIVYDWESIREAPILGASWLDSGEEVREHKVEGLVNVSVQHRDGNVVSATVNLPFTSKDETLGWSYDPALTQAVHNQTKFKISKGYRIKIDGGVGALFREFTGFVEDLIPSKQALSLNCVGHEARLAQTLSENYPDYLSYAAYGYIKTEGVDEPVYGVPAYDHWPYEHAVKDLLYRAWVDPVCLQANKRLSETLVGSPLIYCRDTLGKHLRISRQVHYGNLHGAAHLPPDDDYLYPSEITQSIYQRVQELAQKIGYKFETNAYGEFVFRPKNNPVTPTQLITTGPESINPGAIGGKYSKYRGMGWTYNSGTVNASRVDLIVGRTPDAGKIKVTVTDLITTNKTEAVYDLSFSEEIFYYDNIITPDGINACAITVLPGGTFGPYSLTVTPDEGGATTAFSLNALRLYEQDPTYPQPEFSLRTFDNVLDLKAKSNATSRLNDALVTGRRRTTLTDSAKVETGSEFVVSRATDIHAILNPAADNYTGHRITAFLSDEAIADKDLADWTSRTLVSQYRLPKPDAQITHTALPALELGDAIFVRDNRLETFDGSTVMYVTAIQTTYTFGKSPSATSTIEATVFPPPPSYEPPQELDISLYGNKPIINLNIAYPTLAGARITNPGNSLPQASQRVSESATLQGTPGNFYITTTDKRWSPGSELLRVGQTAVKNNPYYEYYRRTSPTRLDLLCNGGDNSPEYKNPFNAQTGAATTLSYHEVSSTYAENPFYDPYLSELETPGLIDITFDTLITGFYRVSIIDARSSDRTVVAWLTEPGESDPTGEAHWVYIPPGNARNFRWDGVDTLGLWNRKQTTDTLGTFRGAFPEKGDRFEIGAGFYAHNDFTTPFTHISGEVYENEVVYPVGKYAQFFVRVECKRTTDDTPLLVESSRREDLYDTTAANLLPRFIYYHLPAQANAVNLQIEDWDFAAGGAYAPDQNHWTTSVDPAATFRDTKPIRIKLNAIPRRGVAFGGDARHTYIKVHRVAHLTAACMDSSIVYDGAPWNTQNSAEKKRIINRRTVNDQHTLVYADANYTTGSRLVDWVYHPSLFEDDFGRGKEKLRYLDYLQLFEVPHWNPSRFVGEKRSRYLMGYLAYMFYFSVFTQDRSGRLVWAVDPTHTDRSKILYNTTKTQQPFDHGRHQRRVVYTRQWWDTDLLDAALGRWEVPENRRGLYADKMDPMELLSGGDITLYPRNTGLATFGGPHTGNIDFHSQQLVFGGYLPGKWNSATALGTSTTTNLGRWTWEQDFLWIPSPSRDFHPYYAIPPMGTPEWDLHNHSFGGRVNYWAHKHIYAVTLARYSGSSDGLKRMLPTRFPVDPALNDTWFGSARTHSANDTTHDFFRYLLPGVTPTGWFQGPGGNPLQITSIYAEYQRIDEFGRYEDSRGSLTNGQAEAYDQISVAGGEPYYLNPVRYKHFKRRRADQRVILGNPLVRYIYHASADQAALFQLNFRHTYVWESPSHFPVSSVGGITRKLDSSLIDYDLTQTPTRPTAYDNGAWIGWKDDHPSPFQTGSFLDTGSCTTLHWRDDTASIAGGACTIDNPAVAHRDVDNVVIESNKPNYTLNRSIFKSDLPPFAVGPRLPETRRVLFGLCLVNERRANPL